MTDIEIFDHAADYANESAWARFGYWLWHQRFAPDRARRFGMRQWNDRYRSGVAYFQAHDAWTLANRVAR